MKSLDLLWDLIIFFKEVNWEFHVEITKCELILGQLSSQIYRLCILVQCLHKKF